MGWKRKETFKSRLPPRDENNPLERETRLYTRRIPSVCFNVDKIFVSKRNESSHATNQLPFYSMKSRDLDDRQEQTQDCLSSRAPRSMTFVRCLKGRRRKKNQRINYRFVLPPPPLSVSVPPLSLFPSTLPSFLRSRDRNIWIQCQHGVIATACSRRHCCEKGTWKGLRLTIRPRNFSRRGFVSIIRKKYYSDHSKFMHYRSRVTINITSPPFDVSNYPN